MLLPLNSNIRLVGVEWTRMRQVVYLCGQEQTSADASCVELTSKAILLAK